MVTYMLQQLVPIKTTNVKEMSVFWVAKQQRAIERNTCLRKTDFSFSCFKILLKISVFQGGKKKSIQQQEKSTKCWHT